VRPPCDVAPGACKARHQTTANRVGDAADHDRYVACRFLGRGGGGCAGGEDQINALLHKTSGQIAQAGVVALSEPYLDHEVAALDPASFPESLAQRLQKWRLGVPRSGKIADARRLR